MTFPNPSSMDPFLLSPPRQPNLICRLKGLNRVCHYIHSCLETRHLCLDIFGRTITRPSGCSDSTTLFRDRDGEFLKMVSPCVHILMKSTALLSRPTHLLVCHVSQECEAGDIFRQTFVSHQVSAECSVHTHFIHCHTFKSYRIMAYLKPIFYL